MTPRGDTAQNTSVITPMTKRCADSAGKQTNVLDVCQCGVEGLEKYWFEVSDGAVAPLGGEQVLENRKESPDCH